MQIYDHRSIRFLTDTDVLDVAFSRRGRRIIDFVVNYRTYWDGSWQEVVRYDTSHGQRLHIHRFWSDVFEWLEEQRQQDYGQALTEALDDLDRHWRRYRRQRRST